MTIAQTFANGLRVPQIQGALRIQDQRHLILADQPGAGKTAQGLVALEMDGLFTRRSNILILCNLTGCQLTWAKELRTRVASQYDVVIADTTLPRGKTLPSLTQRDDLIATQLMDAEESGRPLIVLANYNMLYWKIGEGTKVPTLWEIEWDAVLIDEAHLVLPTSEDKMSKLTQFWVGLATLPYRTTVCVICHGPVHDVTDHDIDRVPTQRTVPYEPIKIAMTGTPDRGKLQNRYGYWKWFWPESYRNYLSWVDQCFYTEWVERGFNPRTKAPNRVLEVRTRRDPQQWDAYDRVHMLRRTKAEMLAGLPPKQWAEEGGVDLPMTPRQRKAYDDYQADLEAREQQLIADEEHGRAAAAKLLYALRARQMATCLWEIESFWDDDGKEHTTGTPIRAGRDGSSKLAWILDWMEARGYTEANWDPTLGKVVIVSYFTEVLDWLADELAVEGIRSATLKGDTPGDEKLAIQEAFQEGDLRVILLSGYLGVSINLDAADDMIFVDLVHDPDKVEQAEDRIHRASRDHQVTYWRLVSLDSIDVATVEIVDSRYRLTRASYEGSRGVEYARKLLLSAAQPEGENA